MLLGIYSNLPWILPAYYSITTILGAAVLGVDVPPGLSTEFNQALTAASWTEFKRLAHTLTPLLWAYGIGSTAGAVLLGVAGYRAAFAMILAHRRGHVRATEHTDN